MRNHLLPKALFFATAVALSVMTSACSDSPAAPTPSPSPSPITPRTVTLAVANSAPSQSALQMSATAQMSDGSTQDVTSAAEWVSSNPTIATVSRGLVSVRATGEIEVRATFSGVSGALRIFVTGAPVVAIDLLGEPEEGTFQLAARARLADGSVRTVSDSAAWESSNTAVATVSPFGLVTVVADGDVAIRATFQGITGSRQFTVTRQRTFPVSGRVLAAADGRPIAGAVVRVLLGNVAAVTTDAAGNFAFPAVPVGRQLLEASAAGYAPREVSVEVNGPTTTTMELSPATP